MRTLRMKMVMIMVILILALMTVIGAFLISGVGNFYISEFYVQMERTFSPEFITQLQDLADGENGPTQMKELLMAQTGLGIDVNDRNVYILDSLGQVLEGSDERTQVSVSQNLLTAMNGEVGQDGSVTGANRKNGRTGHHRPAHRAERQHGPQDCRSGLRHADRHDHHVRHGPRAGRK